MPAHRHAIIKYQEVTVSQDGCVRYLYNKYFVGAELYGTTVLIAAINGTMLKVYRKDSFEEIVEYPIDYSRDHIEHRHKAEQFKTAEEKAVTRDCAWFDAFVNKECNENSVDTACFHLIRCVIAQIRFDGSDDLSLLSTVYQSIVLEWLQGADTFAREVAQCVASMKGGICVCR